MYRIAKHVFVAVLVIAGWSWDTSTAKAAFTLTFDDVSNTSSVDNISNGYGGMNWNNFFVINRNYLTGTGYQNGTVSGEYSAYNGFGFPASILTANSNGVFTFNSAYLTAAWADGLSITINGLVGSTVMYSQTVIVNTTGPTFFTFNFENITSLEFSTLQSSQFVMDDATFSESIVNPVPARGRAVRVGLCGPGRLPPPAREA